MNHPQKRAETGSTAPQSGESRIGGYGGHSTGPGCAVPSGNLTARSIHCGSVSSGGGLRC
jgi:hypothetical protein